MSQVVITFVIVGAAVLFVLYRTFNLVRKKPEECEEKSPACRGCQLKESCQMTSPKYQ